MTDATRRGVYAKTARRRTEIVDAAFHVFARSGYVNSTMSEIARLAGITVPGLTHHFATKESLLEAVVNLRDADASRHFQGRRGIDYIRGVLEIAERDDSSPDMTRLFAILSAEAGDPGHPAHEYFARRYELVIGSLTLAFRQAAEDGVLRGDLDADVAARACVALADGLGVQSSHVPGTSQATLLRQALQTFFLPRL